MLRKPGKPEIAGFAVTSFLASAKIVGYGNLLLINHHHCMLAIMSTFLPRHHRVVRVWSADHVEGPLGRSLVFSHQ